MPEDVEALDLPGHLRGLLKPGALPAPGPFAPVLLPPVPVEGSAVPVLEPGEQTEAVIRRGGGAKRAEWPDVEALRKCGYFVRFLHTHSVKDDKGVEAASFVTVLLTRP